MGKLENRVIIITGATSGMGKAMAVLFAKEGAHLVLNGRDQEKGESLLNEIQKFHSEVCMVYGDIGEAETNRQLVETAIKKYGKLDTVVANAGVLGLGDVASISIEKWQRTLDINLNSLFYLTKYAVPHLLKNSFGVILANASIAAFKAFPQHAAYCTSKAGQVALIRQLAAEYGPTIRANAICPGPVDTPLIWDSAKAFEVPEKAVQNAADATLMKRLGEPEDIAELALFLISENSSFITGTTVNIDGGITVN
ncbi:glucose 1-dehydrogenase [Leptobacterium flavescens]|uniref:Glucose 1-dehydrogenase n=1 Tax=Leptobacterium flavescens TaxID=472055 RepID=A0A6P0UJW7_9FLAO|nr:SDR family oxidoreductase [Leptobacterium flavescens]NER12842.1 glucose 1-dehydrogenase [Leptobacterium flavescens]